VVLLGDKFVGKTSIIYQLISNKFDQYYIQTMIQEEFTKVIVVNYKKFNINFTVTSGVREYQVNYTSLYKITDFFVVCYDVTNSASFEKAKELITNEIIPYVFYIMMTT
jgi:GTPase SAR1 family protein